MQQRSGKHYLEAKKQYIDTGKLGKVTLARTWWHGNTYHLRKAPESLKHAFQPRLGPLPRSAEVARLGSAAVLQLARLSRFRRRPGHRPVHPLDRRGPHVHGRGHPDRPRWRPAASTTIRMAAPRPTPSTCCWNTRSSSPLPSKRPWFPESPERASNSAARWASSTSTAGATNSRPWGAARSPRWCEASTNLDLDHIQNFLECVKSRKLPNGDVLIGHRSAQASHLGNISYMQKRRIDFDPIREEILPF